MLDMEIVVEKVAAASGIDPGAVYPISKKRREKRSMKKITTKQQIEVLTDNETTNRQTDYPAGGSSAGILPARSDK